MDRRVNRQSKISKIKKKKFKPNLKKKKINQIKKKENKYFFKTKNNNTMKKKWSEVKQSLKKSRVNK